MKDVDGGEATPLTNGRFEELLSAWSPDGGRIAFLRREPKGIFLYVTPASGGAEQKICETGVGLSWSPDGRQLALASPPDEWDRNHILVRSLKSIPIPICTCGRSAAPLKKSWRNQRSGAGQEEESLPGHWCGTWRARRCRPMDAGWWQV
ncbi:MAG: hypothetical protein SFV51_15475 [Bryobacteraceae bacterium]|nr:hypothetical protein [Bryobacteraceae bacterium]